MIECIVGQWDHYFITIRVFSTGQYYYYHQYRLLCNLVMKTVLINSDSIIPTKPKQQFNPHKHRMFNTNVRNLDVDSVHKISDLMGNKKFRQSSNIFYIKLNDKQRSPIKNNTHEVMDETYKTDFQKRKTKIAGFLPQIVNADLKETKQYFLKPKLQSQTIQFDPIYQQAELGISGNNFDNGSHQNTKNSHPGIIKKTQYLFKKGSLNNELEFFRAYNRFEKSKTFQTPPNFNTQLNGIQKTFYHRKKPVSIQRRSMSVRQSDKINLDGNATKSINIEKLQELGLDKSSGRKVAKQRYILKQNLSKKKEELFSPWGGSSDEHQQDHYFKKHL